MPWENKGSGGGPWGGGGSGGGSGGGPWGSGGPGGGPRPPDFEDFIRKGQDRFKKIIPPGGKGSLGGKGIALVVLVVLVLWGLTGFYRVQTNEQGVVLQFGKWVRTTEPGLNWHIPYPVETVLLPGVTDVHQIDIGYRILGADTGRSQRRDVPEESLMLTGDQNIIDIDFTVLWKIADAGKYLFKIRDPEDTVKIAAESAMREVIGRTDIQPALTEARGEVESTTRALLQKTLDDYEAGIEITGLILQDVKPPAPVIDAFDDVQRARQDRDRARNEAEAYRNDVLPRARGDAQRVVQNAQAYKERLIQEAEGEADRFLSVYEAYKENPEVARRRMYLETLQNVLGRSDKVILDSGAGGAIPYLPLNQLRSSKSGPTN